MKTTLIRALAAIVSVPLTYPTQWVYAGYAVGFAGVTAILCAAAYAVGSVFGAANLSVILTLGVWLTYRMLTEHRVFPILDSQIEQLVSLREQLQ